MPPPAEPTGIALDACGLLNLVGAELAATELAQALKLRFVVVEQVLAEAHWIQDVVDGELVRVPVDVSASIGSSLEVAALTDDELGVFVALAADVDDGEAATLAVARACGLVVLTDDRKAQAMALRLGVPLLGTAELLRQCTDQQRMSVGAIGALLRRVEGRARFFPRRDDPLHAWWAEHVNK